jgi:hypothetical protein
VARFDRAARNLVSPGEGGNNKDVIITDVVTPFGGARLDTKSGDGVRILPEMGLLDGVTVGKVLVSFGCCPASVNCEATRKKALELDSKVDEERAQDKGHRGYLRKNRSAPDDVKWERRGVVATVSTSEVISVVRSRITDAEFTDVEVIHLGKTKSLFEVWRGWTWRLCWRAHESFLTFYFRTAHDGKTRRLPSEGCLCPSVWHSDA